MNKKRLYLDLNIINYLRKNEFPSLNDTLNIINDDFTVVFSAAHLEEIAVSEKRYNLAKHKIQEEIDFLEKIAKNNSLRPITRETCELYDESPYDCYNRVVDCYALNDLVESIERRVLIDANRNPLGDPKESNNIKPEEILNKLVYREIIIFQLFNANIITESEMTEALRWSFADLQNKFYVFEAYFNLAANLLEKIGYHREKESKSRSRLHDVSHIIYAAYCDVFVSNDDKLLHKAKAIYSMLKISTHVLSKDDFIAEFSNKYPK